MAVSCRVCGAPSNEAFRATVLRKYDVAFYHCQNCGLLQTEEPYWLNEAYVDAINMFDTGVMARNMAQSKLTASVIYWFFDRDAKFLDYGGGYGILTRLMRDMGFDYYWSDRYSKNLVARGFEYDGRDRMEMVSSFETFEHLVHPKEDIEKMLNISKNLLFSTEVLPDPVPRPQDWWYYGLEHGQHIAFYSRKTLQYIAKTHALELYSEGSVHLLTPERINATKLRTVMKHPDVLTMPLVRRRMKSRTVGDMNHLISLTTNGSKK